MSSHNRSITLQIRLKQIAFTLVKLLIVSTAIYFIYYKLQYNDSINFEHFMKTLKINNIFTSQNISILLIFTLINYCLEGFKWKILVKEIRTISFKEAITQTLSSLTASIITPNRIGEYGAKAIYYSKKNRKKILALNVFGNLSQLFATIIFGLGGLLYVNIAYKITILKTIYFELYALVFLVLIITISYYLKKRKISNKKIIKAIRFSKKISNSTIYFCVIFAILRYLIFSHQFYFLVTLFDLDISYFEAMGIICSSYILVSIVPSIFILDLAIKNGIAIWLFSFTGINEFVVVCITTLMWIMNFAFPAIVGSIFVLKFKYNNA